MDEVKIEFLTTDAAHPRITINSHRMTFKAKEWTPELEAQVKLIAFEAYMEDFVEGDRTKTLRGTVMPDGSVVWRK